MEETPSGNWWLNKLKGKEGTLAKGSDSMLNDGSRAVNYLWQQN